MSYPGPPRYGGGYTGQYGPPGAYGSQHPQNGGYSQQHVAQSPGAYTQGGMDQQHFLGLQAQNQQAFFQNNQQIGQMGQQYNQMNYASSQPNYYQPTTLPVPQQQYSQSQYIDPRQQPQQYTPVRQAYQPHFDGGSDTPPNPNPFRQSQQPQSAPQRAHLQQMSQPIATPPSAPAPVKYRTPTQPTRKPSIPIDPYTLLPPLAEEYFAAAHSMGGSAAHGGDRRVLEQYQKLIATGLGCLESSLSEGRLEPEMEARIRLRYAGVLMEETDNMMEAETALSKGITLCEQNRFSGLKYSMQILLAKVLFTKSPKAALIALDGNIEEVEAFQHHSWIYIFRFLRATLSLQTGKSSDYHVAISNLHEITKKAGRRSDYAVLTYASLLEALACLRTPGPESMENLNRALAAAQTYQLSPECNIPPLKVFAHMLGLVTSLLNDTTEKTFEKLKAFQMLLNETSKDKSWPSKSDLIFIPLNKNKGDTDISSPHTRGLLNTSDDKKDVLVFSFITKADAFMIGFLLAGAARIHVKGEDGTPMKYLKDGVARAEVTKAAKQSGPVSLVQESLRKERTMACHLYMFMAFRAIFTTDWKAAKDALDGLQKAIEERGDDGEPTMAMLLPYLYAMYHQGTGNVDAALELYQGECFCLPDSNKSPQTPNDQVRCDIAIVATMNALLILNSRPDCDIASNTLILDQLKQLCEHHLNVDIQTAYYIVRTVVTTSPPTSQLSTKSYMRSALTGAKKRGNFHLVCITLNVMCTRFFANIIGEQSIKSAMAAKEQSAKSGNRLWMSAATGLLAGSLEIEGRKPEAEVMMKEAVRLANVALVTL